MTHTHLLVLSQALLRLGELVALGVLGKVVVFVGSHCELSDGWNGALQAKSCNAAFWGLGLQRQLNELRRIESRVEWRRRKEQTRGSKVEVQLKFRR